MPFEMEWFRKAFLRRYHCKWKVGGRGADVGVVHLRQGQGAAAESGQDHVKQAPKSWRWYSLLLLPRGSLNICRW